jgi:WD40 repeat protein
MKFSLDSKYLVTASADTTIKTFAIDQESMALTVDKTLYGHSHWVWDIQILADSRHLLSVSSDGYLKCWRLSDGSFIKDNTEKKNDADSKRDGTAKIFRFVAITVKS